MRRNVSRRSISEANSVCLLEAAVRFFLPLRFQGIGAFSDDAPQIKREVARFCERDNLNGAKPHVTAATVDLVPEDPRFAVASTDMQIKTVAIGIHAGFALLLYLLNSQWICFLWHSARNFLQRFGVPLSVPS